MTTEQTTDRPTSATNACPLSRAIANIAKIFLCSVKWLFGTLDGNDKGLCGHTCSMKICKPRFQGRSDGGYIGIYTPKISNRFVHMLKLQWLVKTYIPPSKKIKFLVYATARFNTDIGKYFFLKSSHWQMEQFGPRHCRCTQPELFQK